MICIWLHLELTFEEHLGDASFIHNRAQGGQLTTSLRTGVCVDALEAAGECDRQSLRECELSSQAALDWAG